ncbi:MAG: hypothetical protein QGG48_07760 [Desulfatiglandales bacterium]|nr:hypothetical protein [Desulfatiglandales bacterium]
MAQDHSILINIHVATNRDKDINAIVLLAGGDALDIQKPRSKITLFITPLPIVSTNCLTSP